MAETPSKRYRVVPKDNGKFAVEVSFPGAKGTVSAYGFKSKTEAFRWIDDKREQDASPEFQRRAKVILAHARKPWLVATGAAMWELVEHYTGRVGYKGGVKAEG